MSREASSAGVVVSLQTTSFSTVTDAAGAFGFSGVPVGTYTVAASKPAEWQGTTVSGVLVVRNGTTVLPGTPVTLQPVATANISGAALLELEPDASGTTVTLTGQDDLGHSIQVIATTNASGAYSFTNLRPSNPHLYTITETAASGNYTAASAGTYKFRARLQRTGGSATLYGALFSVPVS